MKEKLEEIIKGLEMIRALWDYDEDSNVKEFIYFYNKRNTIPELHIDDDTNKLFIAREIADSLLDKVNE